MWRLGNVIANTVAAVAVDEEQQKEDYLKQHLESDIQKGASSFLCHYLETLSDRMTSYQPPSVDLGESRADTSDVYENLMNRYREKKDDEDGDGDDEKRNDEDEIDEQHNSSLPKNKKYECYEDFTSLSVWERMFFAVPSPIEFMPLNLSQESSSVNLQSSKMRQSLKIDGDCHIHTRCTFTSTGTGASDDVGVVEKAGNVRELDISENGEICCGGERGGERGGGRGRGRGNDEQASVSWTEEDKGKIEEEKRKEGRTKLEGEEEKKEEEEEEEKEEEEEEEEVFSSGVRRLRQDILALSTDPRLLKIRDFISLPALAALSTSTSTSTLPSQSKNLLSRSRSLHSTLKGSISMSWKKQKQQEQEQPDILVEIEREKQKERGRELEREKEREMEMEADDSTYCTSHNNNLTSKGQQSQQSDSLSIQLECGDRELLALLITRILHGLSSKLLPAAAWKEQTGCWAVYRQYSFEYVLAIAMSILM